MRNGQHESEQQQFIEAVGLSFEQAGLPRMAGRILGWLLICDPPHQSPGELAEVLQASKGSISSMTRLLEQLGLIDRLSLPGERRDYFRIRNESWTALFRRRMELVSTFRQLADQGLALLSEQTPEQRRRLEEMRDMYAFFEYEVPRLLERWEQERRSQSE
jgi:DNA-binding transcriptional regulator GbsR (MarR family)